MINKCTRRWSEVEYDRYEKQLRDVLIDDKDHCFPFDKKMLIHSSRYGCTFAAVDVHLDEQTRELVMVGAVRNGVIVRDEKTGLPSVEKRISIPFREVYDDLVKLDIPGTEMKFIDKTRKAVMDKYITTPLLKLQNMCALQGDKFNVSDFFTRDEVKDLDIEYAHFSGVQFKEDTRIDLLAYDPFAGDEYVLGFRKQDLSYYRKVGEKFDALIRTFEDCKQVYLDRMAELEPVSMSLRPEEAQAHREDAARKMMASRFPEPVKYALKNYFLHRSPALSDNEQKNLETARNYHQRFQ